MARIYIENYGCSANRSNAEIISGLLEKAGCILATKEENADIVIMNTCIVKGPTESKAVKRIQELKSSGKPLIISGCMPEAEYGLLKDIAPDAVLVGPHHIKDIVKAVDILLNSRKLRDFVGARNEVKLCLPKHRYNPMIDIIQISEGCDGKCAYCITRFAKGRLFSYPPEKIISEARAAVVSGCREIWLTSQDCASYEYSLPDLMNSIAQIPGKFFVRVGMMNPDKVLMMIDDLIDSFKNDRIFKFIHIPVQSGNDDVLKRMNRKYSAGEFRKTAERFRKEIPGITISTDIICGFPGETEEQFMDSVKLVQDVRPDILNISRFWPRPGTPAENMDGQVHGRITKDRSALLHKTHDRIALENNQKWVGWKGEALVDEKGKPGTGTMIARNIYYKPIIVCRSRTGPKLGSIIKAKIASATSYDLRMEAD